MDVFFLAGLGAAAGSMVYDLGKKLWYRVRRDKNG